MYENAGDNGAPPLEIIDPVQYGIDNKTRLIEEFKQRHPELTIINLEELGTTMTCEIPYANKITLTFRANGLVNTDELLSVHTTRDHWNYLVGEFEGAEQLNHFSTHYDQIQLNLFLYNKQRCWYVLEKQYTEKNVDLQIERDESHVSALMEQLKLYQETTKLEISSVSAFLGWKFYGGLYWPKLK